MACLKSDQQQVTQGGVQGEKDPSIQRPCLVRGNPFNLIKIDYKCKAFCRNMNFTNAFEFLQLNLSTTATLAVV